MTASPLEQLAKLANLITPVTLPGCVQRPEFRFCRVGYTKVGLVEKVAQIKDDKAAESTLKDVKVPRGKGWERVRTEEDGHEIEGWHTQDSKKLLDWLKAGGNYGIVAGSTWEHEGQQVKLYIHDADEVTAWADAGFFDDLPKRTRIVQSSAENKRHFYFISNIQSSKAHKELPGLGHFKFYASQVVGPGSLHPSGVRYLLIDETTPAFVDAEILTSACVMATKALCPDQTNVVKEMLGVKSDHAGQFKAKADALESKLKKAKVDRIKKIQQQEAQSEAAYSDRKSTIPLQFDAEAEEEKLKAQIEPVKGLISEIGKDESINLCLRRLNASIPTLHRFEKAVSYKGKVGEGEHFLRRAWAVALIKSGYTDAQLHQMAAFFDDYVQSRTQQQFDSIRKWVDGGGKYYPCAEIRAYLPPELCQGCKWTPPVTQAQADKDESSQTADPDPEISAEAERIINEGRFPEFWVEVYHRRHNGDQIVALEMPIANLTANIKNSTGIAVLQIGGPSGDGKSHAVLCTAQQMGRWCDISGLSPMALLYHAGKSIFAGMMVVLDDNRPTDQQADIHKKSSTQFKTGYRYKTVIKGKDVTLQMPPGVQLLTTEVDADSEDQVLNRTLFGEVEGTSEKDIAIINADLERLENGDMPEQDPDILVCQAAFDLLKSKTYVVTIPDARKHIRWKERTKDQRANLRNYNIFMDMILAYAVMRWPCRVHKEDDAGVMHVEATCQDFMDALALYHTVHKAMRTKLLASEIKLLTIINDAGGRILKEDAQKNYGASRQHIDNLVKGRNGTGGLLGKFPGFYQEDATESSVQPASTGYYEPRVLKRYLCLTENWSTKDGQTLITTGMSAEWIEN